MEEKTKKTEQELKPPEGVKQDPQLLVELKKGFDKVDKKRTLFELSEKE